MAGELPASAKDLIRFVPARTENGAAAPVYFIARSGLETRARWRRDLKRSGATHVSVEDLRTHCRDAALALLTGDTREQALADLELIGNYFQEPKEQAETAPQEVAGALVRIAELEEQARRDWPPYAEAVADRDFWWEMARLLATRHFLRGWEGVSAPCAACGGRGTKAHAAAEAAESSAPAPEPEKCGRCAGDGRVPVKFQLGRDGLVEEASFRAIPEGDVYQIGSEAIAAMTPTAEQRKN